MTSSAPQLRSWEAMNILAERITSRDRDICQTLYEHPVLTTDQLAELHFASLERARKRLTQLRELRVVDRFRPLRSKGSSPYHYLLDQLGAQLVAIDRGIDPSDLNWSRAGSLRLAPSQQLTHLIEASGFFTRLSSAAKATGRGELAAWWGQRRCAQAWGEVVRPDGYANVRLDGAETEVWVEWDRGTETQARLRGKLDRYQELALALDRTITLLIVLPTDRREQETRRGLQSVDGVQVLTSTADRHMTNPLARNWLAAGSEQRASLAALATNFTRQDRNQPLADQQGSSAGPTSTEHTCPQEHEYD